ncbi:MAG: NADPH-dependent F420 reductase [Cytophagales bacterium]|nr:NADPH-dependent F420 reductase [Cytophagales bacterium]
MNIGIIGAGNIGATAARLFTKAGHQVALSNSRGPDSLEGLVQELGPRARALPVEEAARFGEVVLLAVPWHRPEALPSPESLRGKIVIDAMNPYRPGGGLYDLGHSTSSEETAKRLPGVRLVKAFNSIWYKHLAENGDVNLPLGQRHAIYLAGDDAQAKAVVRDLIAAIGFDPVDTGSLREGGRKQQPESPVYNQTLRGAEAESILRQL